MSNQSNKKKYLAFNEFVTIFILIILNIFISNIENTFSYIFPVIIMLLLLRKENISSALVFYISCLFFSDSAINYFFIAGNNSKDVLTVLLAGYLYFNSKIKTSLILGILTPFLIIATISTLLSDLPLLIPIQKLFSYTLIIYIFSASWTYLNNKGLLKHIFRIISFFVFALFAWSLINFFLGVIEYSIFNGRFNGIQRNPNGVGIFCSLIFIFLHSANNKFLFAKKKFLNIVFITLFSALLLSGSRNGIVAVFIYTILGASKLKFWPSLLSSALLIFFYESFILNISELASNYDLNQEFRTETLDDASGRVFVWKAAWLEIQNNYWIGSGFSFEVVNISWLGKYMMSIPELIESFGNIHNSYLTIWLGTGLFGLLSFIVALFVIFKRISKGSPFFNAAYFSILFLGIFESWMVASLNPYTWIMWSIASIGLISLKNDTLINN